MKSNKLSGHAGTSIEHFRKAQDSVAYSNGRLDESGGLRGA
jgi:hypothetical protein